MENGSMSLKAKLDEGSVMLAEQPSSASELGDYNLRCSDWTDRTASLIRRSLGNAAADRFYGLVFGVLGAEPSVDVIKGNLRSRIGVLRDLLGG